ncbi:MAG: bifunctional demethylmenaquinone methyltransferase/2-methoxy-6-polyprenyl-1,4-benzoquinol methylase UbiE [Flavobacteriaceae bacterium]
MRIFDATMHKNIKPFQDQSSSKKEQVTQMFDHIAKNYDGLNRIMTLRIDQLWRKRVVKQVEQEKPQIILDIATGTADLAIALHKTTAKEIIGLDIAPQMLAVGQKKIDKKKLNQKIKLQLGDSENLPFKSNTFDIVTVAFGVRNFENLDLGLQEVYRVLKPRGKAIILETAVPKNKLLRWGYHWYTQNFLPFIGKRFAKDRTAYRYLSDSAAAFPCGAAFNNILEKNGFIMVEDNPQTLGVASIYCAFKP